MKAFMVSLFLLFALCWQPAQAMPIQVTAQMPEHGIFFLLAVGFLGLVWARRKARA